MTLRVPLAAALPLFLSGCILQVARTGPTQYDSKEIERDNSELVKTDLHMGAGELKLQGGAKKLMEANFTYNVPAWKPEVRYINTGVRGYLTIEQPSSGRVANVGKYQWEIALNDDVPLDLRVRFGAGEAQLDLGSLTLRSVEVDMGVGKIDLDLRGQPKRDYDVRIRGGVGEATIHLPREAGVYADASGGIGGIHVRGLRKQGNHYVNEAYDTAKVKVHLDVRGGIGAINLIGD
jgi:predicted membrane protein